MSKKSKYDIKYPLNLESQMYDDLRQLSIAHKKPVAELIRDACRVYLDDQEQIIASRKYFNKSLRDTVGALEVKLSWQVSLLVTLITYIGSTLIYEVLLMRRELRVAMRQPLTEELSDERLRQCSEGDILEMSCASLKQQGVSHVLPKIEDAVLAATLAQEAGSQHYRVTSGGGAG